MGQPVKPPLLALGTSLAVLIIILLVFATTGVFPSWYLQAYSTSADAPGRILQLHSPTDFAVVAAASMVTTSLLTVVKAESSKYLSTVFSSTTEIQSTQRRDVHRVRQLVALARAAAAGVLVLVGVSNLWLLLLNTAAASGAIWVVTMQIEAAPSSTDGKGVIYHYVV